MAFQNNNLYAAGTTNSAQAAVIPTSIQPKTFGAGTGTLVPLQPLAFNSSTGFWVPWDPAVVSEEADLGTTGTVSGGTFTITVNGETTAAIAYNATAATIAAALLALGGIDPGDVVVTGDMPSSNIAFGGQFVGQNVTTSVNTASISGGGAVTLLATNGVATNGVNLIAGFLWPNELELNASGELIESVLMGGRILFDSIPIVSGLYTSNQLAAALKGTNVRKLGFNIEGLPGFN
jgi:hypothetical protein